MRVFDLYHVKKCAKLYKCYCYELSKALGSRDYCMKPEHYYSSLAAFSLSLLFADLRAIDRPSEPFFLISCISCLGSPLCVKTNTFGSTNRTTCRLLGAAHYESS